MKGIIAAGHTKTAESAQIILEEGGNAFDAALAAICTACFAEPALASMGGGGFLLAAPASGPKVLYDFFVQTPLSKSGVEKPDFYPVICDFGGTKQEYFVGLASIATPGIPSGIMSVHRDLATLPMKQLVAPAVDYAKNGVEFKGAQHFVLKGLEEIYAASPEALAVFGDPQYPQELIKENSLFKNPDYADFLESFALEDERLFYLSEIGKNLDRVSREQGGFLRKNDLEDYVSIKRRPLEVEFANTELITNPLPSTGGRLLALTLQLLETSRLHQFEYGSFQHLDAVIKSMLITEDARRQNLQENKFRLTDSPKLIRSGMISELAQKLNAQIEFSGNTTHISVADRQGNLASATITNGQGSGYIIPKTGIVLNNMLGEPDLNPSGYHQWPENRRISSMMAPSILIDEKGKIVMGTGGASRIRSALLQFILNLKVFGLPLDQAVNRGRVHYELNELQVEDDFSPVVLSDLQHAYPNFNLWAEKNYYFGGVHAVSVSHDGREVSGVGDERREGVFLIAK